jgi:hypothetical protein
VYTHIGLVRDYKGPAARVSNGHDKRLDDSDRGWI